MPKKLTPRQIAGRNNRKKRKGLTLEGKEALRQAALSNRPWEYSTGPRTRWGKMRSRENALQHGGRAWELMPEEFKTVALGIRQAEKGEAPLPGQGLDCLRDLMSRANNLEQATRCAWLILRWSEAARQANPPTPPTVDPPLPAWRRALRGTEPPS